MKRTPKLLMFISFLFILNTCIKKEEVKEKDIYAFDVKQETDWNYWAVAKDGSSFSVQVINSIPSVIYFKPVKEADGYPIFVDENGIPSKAVFENHVFIFGNYRKNLMDISVVLPGGNIRVFRDVAVAFDFTTLQKKGIQGSNADIIKWAGHIVSAAACGIGIVAAVPSGLTSFSLAYIGCSAMVVSLAVELSPEAFASIGVASSAVSAATGYIGCMASLGLSCALDYMAFGLEITGAGVDLIESQPEQIYEATGLLDNGIYVKTNPILLFSCNSATVGGVVSSDNYWEIAEKGIYWGPYENPEITGTKVNIGSGTGTFSKDISGLSPNKLYYVKAYATSTSNYEVKGTQVSFTTSIQDMNILIESTVHHLGDNEGNEGTQFTKAFSIYNKDCYVSASFQLSFNSPLGPNSATPPIISINSHTLPSVLASLPSFSNPCWTKNGDNSYDYNCSYTYTSEVKSFLINGSNTFKIMNGRTEDDYNFSNVKIILKSSN